MISGPYDILRNTVQENPIWVEAVENLEMAKRRVVELVARAPGQYLVFCQRTGRFVSTITAVASPVAHDQNQIHDGSSVGQSDTLF